MKDDPVLEWEEHRPEGCRASCGNFTATLEPWTNETEWQLYMELDVSSAAEGKAIAEAVLRVINSFGKGKERRWGTT